MKVCLTKEATYDGSYAMHSAMFAAIVPPVDAGKVCHLYRVESSKEGKYDGIKKDSIAGVGHWAQRGAMEQFYLSLTLEMDFIRNAAGFPSFKGCYNIHRAFFSPTQVFLHFIF